MYLLIYVKKFQFGNVDYVDEVRENYYQKHISDSPVKPEILPLVHVCDCYTFRDIFVSGQIEPTMCKVFDEELAYYFYGRPSYRVGKGDETTNATSMFPICFVVDASQLGSITSAYPFDTGAFEAGVFSDYTHAKSQVNDFKLKNDFEFIRKFVGYFYVNNQNYYDGSAALAKQELPPMAFELHSVLQMISSEAKEPFDDRCHTIEIQTNQNVDIRSGMIMALVVPSAIANDTDLASFLFDYNIKLITYHTSRCTPSSLTSTMIDKVREFYSDEGVI